VCDRVGTLTGPHVCWNGGPDPTELLDSAQQVIHRPTGARHTSPTYPSQPFMAVGLFCLEDLLDLVDCGVESYCEQERK
jgi:hypothetical protein